MNETYQPAVDRAWQAVCERVRPEGQLLGVCESTGTQATLDAYLMRKLNDGVDQRGGAMALLFATELMSASQRHDLQRLVAASADDQPTAESMPAETEWFVFRTEGKWRRTLHGRHGFDAQAESLCYV